MTLVIGRRRPRARATRRPRPAASRCASSRPARRCGCRPGVTVFDAASWNGIAIDSTCGGHGTCKKCKVQIVDGAVAASPLDARAFSEDELAEGWRLACRAAGRRRPRRRTCRRSSTRPKAATVGVGRQVILHPALQKRYVELDEPSLADQRTDLQRSATRSTTSSCASRSGVLRRLPGVLRASGYKVTCVVVDDLLIDVEPGDTTGGAARDRVRPRHDHRGRDAARHRHRHPGRRPLDAQPAAAVRGRRDLAHLRDHARPRRPAASPHPGGGDAAGARRRGVRARRRPARVRCTRWRSPATRR